MGVEVGGGFQADPGGVLEAIRQFPVGECLTETQIVKPGVSLATCVENLAYRQEILAKAIDDLRKRPLPLHPA